MMEMKRRYDRRCKPETRVRARWRMYKRYRKRKIEPIVERYFDFDEYAKRCQQMTQRKLAERLAAYRKQAMEGDE